MATTRKLTWRQKLYRLAVKRAALDEVQSTIFDLEVEFREQHKALFDRMRTLKDAVDGLDQEVREEAHDEFLETGDKELAPGIKVRMVDQVRYDEEQAHKYASRHAPDLFKFDSKGFEKVAKALAKGRQPLPFVEIAPEPQITISKSLPVAPSAYVDVDYGAGDDEIV